MTDRSWKLTHWPLVFFLGAFAGAAAGAEELFAPPAGIAIEEDPAAAPADVAGDAGIGYAACCDGCTGCLDWSKIPQSIRPMPRPGNFPIPRGGCGFYSLCDQLQGNCRPGPPKSGYPRFAAMPPSFFDADFRYVDSIPWADRTFAEKLKRLQPHDGWMFSTGGQFWSRYMHENNSRLTANNNTYDLVRVRAYGDLMYKDLLRVYAEFIWADSFREELAPLATDVNRGDLLNLFVDVKLSDCCGEPLYLRVGRQELLFGSQRLVSTLDWANTRRTFEGVRLLRRGEQWDFDAFWTQFVPADPSRFDEPDENRDFAGAWLTYRPQKGHFVDFYYLYFQDLNDVVQQGITRAPTEANTIGTRYAGDCNGFLWDYELALQFGNQNREDLFAGAATLGVGRHWANCRLKPTAWIYYDYASGDSNPEAGDAHTFNHLYPFGHYYLGWIDQVGRQNIHDLNAHLYFYPQPWITVWLQYHHFWLDESRDALYNAGGVARRRDATGAAGNNVGDELDIVLNFHLANNADLMLGYSKLFGGRFLRETAGPTDAELFYAMFQQRW